MNATGIAKHHNVTLLKIVKVLSLSDVFGRRLAVYVGRSAAIHVESTLLEINSRLGKHQYCTVVAQLGEVNISVREYFSVVAVPKHREYKVFDGPPGKTCRFLHGTANGCNRPCLEFLCF